MLTCAHDNCTVTAELKKNKYVYYRCSGYRGKCDLPRFREQEIAERLGDILKNMYIPEEVVRTHRSIVGACTSTDAGQGSAGTGATGARTVGTARAAWMRPTQTNLTARFQRISGSGNMPIGNPKNSRIKSQIAGLNEDMSSERLLNMQRILELAKGLFSVPYAETGRTSRIAQKCTFELLDRCCKSLSYLQKALRSDLQRAKNQEWSGREDLNLRPPGPEPGALPG